MNYAQVSRAYCFATRDTDSWIRRSNPDHAFVFVREGRFEFQVEGREGFEAQPGDLCHLPGGSVFTIRHAPGSTRGFHCSNGFYLGDALPESLQDGMAELERRQRVRISEPLHMDALYREMYAYHSRPGFFRSEIVETLFARILLLTMESLGTERVARPEVWEQMIAYLDTHYREPIGREDLARLFGYTPQYVNALFKNHVGVNVNAYIHHKRCIEARQRLTLDHASVKEVAYEMGYNDPNYFARMFRRHCGVRPSDCGSTADRATTGGSRKE